MPLTRTTDMQLQDLLFLTANDAGFATSCDVEDRIFGFHVFFLSRAWHAWLVRTRAAMRPMRGEGKIATQRERASAMAKAIETNIELCVSSRRSS